MLELTTCLCLTYCLWCVFKQFGRTATLLTLSLEKNVSDPRFASCNLLLPPFIPLRRLVADLSGTDFLGSLRVAALFRPPSTSK
jgi:hypothetical protein